MDVREYIALEQFNQLTDENKNKVFSFVESLIKEQYTLKP